MTDLNFSRRGVMGALIAAGAFSAIDLALPDALFAASIPGSQIDAALKAAYEKYRTLNEGKNADYIPALAQVPSTYFGIAVVGSDGKIHEAGGLHSALLDPVDLQGDHRSARGPGIRSCKA